MKILRFTVCVGLTAIWCCGAFAREADVLDFSRSSVSTQAKLDTDWRAHPPGEGVAMAMQTHFELNGFGHQVGDKGGFANNFGDLPARNLAIPDWIQSRRRASITKSGMQLGFESDLRSWASDHCDGARYAAAWWLSRDVESRRTLYFDQVAATACEFGLPTNLLDAVIAQESGYKSWAVSTAGAMGIMQIMPGTARLLGLVNPFDPAANMRAGARYLRQQFDRFGRVDLALAAYNAGPERRSLSAGYVPAIPETRNYVRTITTNWARLAQLGVGGNDATSRGEAAMVAVHASGYRSVELVRYDGLNAANPM